MHKPFQQPCFAECWSELQADSLTSSSAICTEDMQLRVNIGKIKQFRPCRSIYLFTYSFTYTFTYSFLIKFASKVSPDSYNICFYRNDNTQHCTQSHGPFLCSFYSFKFPRRARFNISTPCSSAITSICSATSCAHLDTSICCRFGATDWQRVYNKSTTNRSNGSISATYSRDMPSYCVFAGQRNGLEVEECFTAKNSLTFEFTQSYIVFVSSYFSVPWQAWNDFRVLAI